MLFLYHRLVGQAEPGGLHKTATAQVMERRYAVTRAQPNQLPYSRIVGEAADEEIAGVYLEERSRTWRDGPLIVREIGAVGGPNLPEYSAALRQDVRYAKASPDLHGPLPLRQ